MQPRFVAIVGGSGSGKTWLAHRLTKDLKGIATLIPLDAFYRDLAHLTIDQRALVNFDDPQAIDWACLKATLVTLRAGARGRIPRYDFATHTRLSGELTAPPAPLVILEGLWLLHPPWLRPWFDLGVFVHCEESVRLSRRIRRDTKERGRDRRSVREQFERQVRPMHDLYVEPQRRWAERIVPSPIGRLEEAGLRACLRELASRP